MSDTVDRQAAIATACSGIVLRTGGGEWRRITDIEKDLTALPSAQPEANWIPCKEQMPPAGHWAIWCSKKGLIQVARWKEDAIDHFWPSQEFFQLEDAVAWMPLPKPYSEEEKK